MSETIIAESITKAVDVAELVEKLAAGVVETDPSADPRLQTDNIHQRRTYVSRNVQHLKRMTSQTWFTDALSIEQFTAINNAIVAGEDYLG